MRNGGDLNLSEDNADGKIQRNSRCIWRLSIENVEIVELREIKIGGCD